MIANCLKMFRLAFRVGADIEKNRTSTLESWKDSCQCRTVDREEECPGQAWR
jgi:hypothetical protein